MESYSWRVYCPDIPRTIAPRHIEAALLADPTIRLVAISAEWFNPALRWTNKSDVALWNGFERELGKRGVMLTGKTGILLWEFWVQVFEEPEEGKYDALRDPVRAVTPLGLPDDTPETVTASPASSLGSRGGDSTRGGQGVLLNRPEILERVKELTDQGLSLRGIADQLLAEKGTRISYVSIGRMIQKKGWRRGAPPRTQQVLPI